MLHPLPSNTSLPLPSSCDDPWLISINSSLASRFFPNAVGVCSGRCLFPAICQTRRPAAAACLKRGALSMTGEENATPRR
uniref:Uncharacterized protein n=1 Tax=Knipowitschia caucasica TaxID=637954 RepID=A0AAV2JIK4_KNICA